MRIKTATTALFTLGDDYTAYADGTRTAPTHNMDYLLPWIKANGKRVEILRSPDVNEAGDYSSYAEYYVKFPDTEIDGYYVNASELSDFRTDNSTDDSTESE